MKRHHSLLVICTLWFCAVIAIRLTYGLFDVEALDSTWHNICVAWLRSGLDATWLISPLVLLFLCKRTRAAVTIGVLWTAIWYILAWTTVRYARHFGTPIHYSDLTLVQNLNGLGSSIAATIRCKDFLLCIPVFFGLGCWLHFIRRASSSGHLGWHAQKKTVAYFTTLLCCNGILFILTSRRHDYVESGADRNLVFRYYGIFHLIRYDIIGLRRPSPAEIEWAKQYLKERTGHISESEVSPSRRSGENLIFILVESLPSWVIGKTVNGTEITPNLNRLVREEATLYWPCMVPQTRSGRSSDAQLLINTGLLPTRTGTVANIYAHHTFPDFVTSLRQFCFIA